MPFLRCNNIVLHYRDQGDPSLPVLVFSNSLGTDFRIWDDVAGHLDGRYRMIRYDKRGHGLTEATPAPYRLNDHVNDLAALLDALDIRTAAVIGLSVGGMIAQGLAALRPELVSAMVLCDTAHRIGNDTMWNQRIEAVSNGGIDAIGDSIMERWFTRRFCASGDPAYAGYRAMLTRTTVDGYVGTCAALRDADLTESTRALSIPVLCIVGDEDGSTPPDLVRSTAKLIKDSRFEIVECAGHLPCIEQPLTTAHLIEGFIGVP